MQLYYSTGGVKTNEQFDNIVESPFGIEFSGGKYLEDIHLFLSGVKSKNFQFHNYFPVPKETVVLNLSSESEDIQRRSIMAYKNAIDLSKEFGLKYFSLHAGFLIDPKPNELSNLQNSRSIIPYDVGLENFAKNLEILSKYAGDRGVILLVENNVTSATTMTRFGFSPLLFTDVETAKDLVSILPNEVGVLCDLAHLNVSSHVLRFNKSDVINLISERTYGIHLSHNDRSEDTNRVIIEHTWYKKYVSTLEKSEFITLETYDYSKHSIMQQYEKLQEFIS